MMFAFSVACEMTDNNYLLRKKRDDSNGNWALAAIKQAFSEAAGEVDFL